MTINKEQMERIRRHLDGDKQEALGAWILDKNALNLALERVISLETSMVKMAKQFRRYGGNDFSLAAGELEELAERT